MKHRVNQCSEDLITALSSLQLVRMFIFTTGDNSVWYYIRSINSVLFLDPTNWSTVISNSLLLKTISPGFTLVALNINDIEFLLF